LRTCSRLRSDPHTGQGEIGEREGVSVQPVKDAISDIMANLPKNLKAAAEHAEDLEAAF